MQVLVRDNNVDQALRALKKKMQREGIFREMKMRRSYEKPSERRAREKAEAIRPADNDESILRWNTCARMINRHQRLKPATEDPRDTFLE